MDPFGFLVFQPLLLLRINPYFPPGKNSLLFPVQQLCVDFRQMLFHIHKGQQDNHRSRHNNIEQIEGHGHELRYFGAGHYTYGVHKAQLQDSGFKAAGKRCVNQGLHRRNDSDPHHALQTKVSLVFNAVKGIAHKCRKNIRIGKPAYLPQEARNQRRHQLIREHPAKNAPKQRNGVSGDRQIFDTEFFCHGIDNECADAGHGAGNHRINGVHQWVFRTAQQKLDVKILHIAALKIIHNAADCG